MTALYDMSVKSNKSNLLDGAHTLKIVYSKYSGKDVLKRREMKIDCLYILWFDFCWNTLFVVGIV